MDSLRSETLYLLGAMKAENRKTPHEGTARAIFALLEHPIGLSNVLLAKKAQLPAQTVVLIRSGLIAHGYARNEKSVFIPEMKRRNAATIANDRLAFVGKGIVALHLDLMEQYLPEKSRTELVSLGFQQYASGKEYDSTLTAPQIRECITREHTHTIDSALYRGLGAYALLRDVHADVSSACGDLINMSAQSTEVAARALLRA